MAARITCRSSFSTASFAALMEDRYAGIATAARIAMMSMTIISSSSVNPASASFPVSRRPPRLPIGILGSVQGRALRFCVHIVQILSAERVAVGIILLRTHAPIGLAGHRIDRNTAQEPHLLPLHLDALHQRLQIRRIVVAVHLGLDAAFIGCVLVGVNRPAHLPQIGAQLALLDPLDVPAGNGHGSRREQAEDGHGHDQLDQRKTGLALVRRRRRAWAEAFSVWVQAVRRLLLWLFVKEKPR